MKGLVLLLLVGIFLAGCDLLPLDDCEKVKELIGQPGLECCPICHDLARDGHKMFVIVVNGKNREVCCTVAAAFYEWKNGVSTE